MTKNFKHISHIKSKFTKTVEEGEFYGLTPTADNSDNAGSSPVKLNIAKRPTADQIIEGEIAVNYLKGHETLTIKNSENEIVGFVNENELYETQEIITNGLTKLKAESSADLKKIENKVTEFDEGIDDLELVVSSSLNDLNTRINELNGVMASLKVLSNIFLKGHEYVDLGLPSGTLWATMNVGAEKETDYGLYFAWGDTQGYTASQVGSGEGKKAFSWADYKFNPSGDGSTMSKYNSTDVKTVLDLEDDAVHVNWGGQWHMPTEAQCQELFDNTYVTNEWVTDYNGSGVKGYLFTSVSNGNTLFLPAAGFCDGGSVNGVDYNGSVWASSLGSSNVSNAWGISFDIGGGGVYSSTRYSGYSVRGVIG